MDYVPASPGAAIVKYGCIIPDTNPHGGDMKLRNLFVVLVVSLALVQVAGAQDHWVATWAAAPQQARGGPQANPAPAVFNDQTVRMIVHTSLGGRRARVTLSNTFGNMPLKVGAAHVAL